MPKLDLDLNDGDKLTVNKAYADRYDNWRRLEELQKLKDKYGSDVEDDSDSASSSDEEPTFWSAQHEKDFLRILSALKTHDPMIYSDKKFFISGFEEPSTSSFKNKKKDPPMFLKDYERKLILERGGDISDDEDDKEEQKTLKPGYYEQQEQIKRELKAALSQSDNSDDSEPLLKQRVKTCEEVKKEEDEYYEWLKGQKNEDLPDAKELKGLKDAWNDANLDDDEKFLRDYLLNKRYEVDDKDDVPNYEEIVNIEKEEEELKKENEFERHYNFRYEEPDQEFIKQYPRTIKQSLRKKDDRRKQKRDAYKQRKRAEKQARKDEIKELKSLKRKEIEEKLLKLKKLAGDDELPLNVNDLELDFDPAVYDRRMKEIFSSTYYEKSLEEDEEKPVFSDISNDSSDESNYDTFDVNKERLENEAEQTNDDEINEQKLSHEKKPNRKKRKRNSRFVEAVLRKKPLFDPKEKTFEEYFNEYYALDYEDIIADGLITKFKYRDVPANDFGISIDELLNADDRQLNAWASLKKATAYRSEAEELYDIKAYKKKASNFEKKKRIFSTDFGGKKSKKLSESDQNVKTLEETERTNAVSTKKNKKNKRKLLKNNSAVKEEKRMETSVQNEQPVLVKKKKIRRSRRKKQSAFGQFISSVRISDDRLRAYGVNPKKYINKLFHHQKNRMDMNQSDANFR